MQNGLKRMDLGEDDETDKMEKKAFIAVSSWIDVFFTPVYQCDISKGGRRQ